MVAIRVFDNAARNLMRPVDADCIALTRVGKITHSTHGSAAGQARIPLILRIFFCGDCAAVQHRGHRERTDHTAKPPPFGRGMHARPLRLPCAVHIA